MTIETDLSFHTKQTDTLLTCFFKRIAEEFQSIAFTLIVGMDADGPKSPGLNLLALIRQQPGFGIHHMPDDFTVFFHHEVKFRNKIGMIAVAVQYKMFGAAGTIDIPKGFTGQVLHLSVVLRGF